LLDAGEITAAALAKLLETHHLVNPQKKRGKKEFYVSDLTPAFAQMANEFFGKKIRLNKVKIP
jgi:glutamate racemase